MFIHSSVDGCLGCFRFSAIMNDAAGNNRCVHFVCVDVFNSLGYILRSGISGRYVNSTLNFFEELPHFFRVCIPLNSQQQRTRIPTSPRPCQHLAAFLVLAIAVDGVLARVIARSGPTPGDAGRRLLCCSDLSLGGMSMRGFARLKTSPSAALFFIPGRVPQQLRERQALPPVLWVASESCLEAPKFHIFDDTFDAAQFSFVTEAFAVTTRGRSQACEDGRGRSWLQPFGVGRAVLARGAVPAPPLPAGLPPACARLCAGLPGARRASGGAAPQPSPASLARSAVSAPPP